MYFMDTTSVIGCTPMKIYQSDSLNCSRSCLMDPSCIAYSLPRNLDPTNVECKLYDQVPALQYNKSQTMYFTNGNGLSAV